MRAILPGRPQSKRQALSTAHWDGLRLVAYISGNAAVISSRPHRILQTLYIDSAKPLHAIAIEESSGRIAICDHHSVYIYDPVGRDDGLLRWQEVHEHTEEDALVTSLSWASPEELLIGGSRLRLWYLPETGTAKFIWDQPLAYATAFAYCSQDGELIASCGPHDRMVKIWRRLSFEVESTRFDISYLPHPTSVTNIHWRKPWHTEQNLDNLLYTFCADSRLRVWAHLDHHSAAGLQQVADIDMCNIIQPRRLSVGSMSRRRYAFIIDSRDFSTATENAVQSNLASTTDHALEHLIAIANRTPEICIFLDGLGHMSAWGLENAGCRNKKPTEVFNIAHIGDLNISLTQRPHRLDDYSQFCIFAGGSTDSSLSVLVHSFDGFISWYETHITHLFDTAPRHERARLLTSLAGHNDPVKGIVRSQNGKLLCSWTEDGDVIVWKVKSNDQSTSLLLQQSFSLDINIIDAEFFGDDLFLLRYDCLQVLPADTEHKLQRSAEAKRVSRLGAPGSFGVFYDNAIDVYKTKSCTFVTALQIPPDSTSAVAVPVLDPPGGRQDVITVGPNGLVTGLVCDLSGHLAPVASYPSSVINPVHVSAFGGKVALVDEDGMLTIWDSPCQVCEAEVDVGLHNETVGSLAWHRTRSGNSLLAVACTFKIIILAQCRYGDQEAWSIIQVVRMRDHTSHSIGCICFLADGNLVVGAGNQIFVPEISITVNEEDAGLVREIFFQAPEHRKKKKELPALPLTDVADALSCELPVYHPKTLHLLLDTGQFDLAVKILVSLQEHLKYFVQGEELSSMLNFTLADLTGQSPTQPPRNGLNHQAEQNGDSTHRANGVVQLSEVAERLKENVEKQRIPYLSIKDHSSLISIIGTVTTLEQHRTSVDDHALCYLHGLYSSSDTGVSWRSIMHASLSTCQEVLVDLVTQHYSGKLTWEAARKSGLFMWLSEPESVRTQMENVGRAEYTKNEDRSPVDCSLYYLALDKKNVLQGLWRTSVGVKEKANTVKLLANNFQDRKWKATALKNAYALLSKRRFEYAAAFFLLGGSLKDAVGVCVHQIGDLQLAVAIARVYNDEGLVLKQLIEGEFLGALAKSLEGRWMAAWAYGIMLDRPEKAVQAMVRPLWEVLGMEMRREVVDYRVNDPLLAGVCAELRKKVPGAVSPREEWRFVMRCAMYFARMSREVLGLGLVRNWEFLHIPAEQKVTKATTEDVEEDEQKKDQAVEVGEADEEKEKKKPPPTQFVEPSADSLLDSFGF
jgi:WD40 repeat protein